MKKSILLSVLLSMILFHLPAQSASQLFQEGKDAFSDKLFSRSIESFKEFLEQYPSDPRIDQADYMIGVSLFYLRKFNSSINHFKDFEKQYPGSAYLGRIHYWKGLCYYGQDKYRSAIPEFIIQSEIDGEVYFKQKSLQLLAYSYEKLEQYEKAIESYAKLYETKPGKDLSALALERQGYINLTLKNYREALKLFDRVVVEYNDVPQFLKDISFYQGECYFHLEEYENSLKKFETFLTLYSSSDNRELAVFRLGSIHAYLQNQDAAKEYMNLLTEEYPDSDYIMQAHIILAESYMNDGNHLAARVSLTRLLEEEKDPIEIQKLQFNMGRSWEENPEESLKWYISASRGLDPEIASESLYRSASIQEGMGNEERTALLYEKLFNQYKSSEYREEAGEWIVLYYEKNAQDLPLKNHLDRMLSEYPENDNKTLYLYMRGNLSYKEGKNNEALRYYQNILNVEKDNDVILNETRYRIAYIYTLRKEFYRASDYFLEIVNNNKRNELYYRAILSLGICYLNVKDNDKAEAQFEILTSAPNVDWTGDAYFYLGKINMEKADYQKAAEYYLQASELGASKERRIQSLYQLGWSYMRLASFAKASEAFDKLYAMDQNHSLSGDSLYRSGVALSYQEAWSESLIRFSKALELIEYFTLREELLYQTAWSYFMVMDFDAALDYLKQLEKEFPESPLPADALFRASEALFEKNEIEEAVKSYLALVDEFPESPLVETSLYRALTLSTDVDEKLDRIQEFLKRFSGNERALQAALQLEKLIKNVTMTENQNRIVDEILALDLNGTEESIILLGLYFHELNDLECLDKLADLINLAGIRPAEVAKISLYKGICYYHNDDYDKAGSYFKATMEGDFTELSAEAQYYTAKMHENGSEWKKAADEYLRILYRYPEQTEWVIESLYLSAINYKKAGDLDSFQRTTDLLKDKFPQSDFIKALENEESTIQIESNPELEEDYTSEDLEDLVPSDEILPMLE